jgi:MFS family permease
MDKKVQYIAVGFLGLSFMLMFTAFNSLQNMIAEIYDGLGLKSLGQIALFSIYGAFGITTFISSYLIEKFGYKKIMFFSGLGYGFFELTGLLVTSCGSANSQDGVCSTPFIYFVVLLGAVVCGFCASLIWVSTQLI